jgi:GDP-mannose 6-dehydrogenase
MVSDPDKVGMVGLAFKPNTDDMRESPFVSVAKSLVGEGATVKIFDPCVNPEQLIGANKEQVRRALRHLEDLLVSSLDELNDCDVVLINHATVDVEQVNAWLGRGIKVIDLANIAEVDRSQEGYEGIYW